MNSEKTKFNSEKIHFIQTDKLKENELNKFKLWSGDTYNTISASIQSKGILVPLIIRDDSTILDGHNRWRVAIELGIEKLPCIIAPKFQSKAEKYRRSNRLQTSHFLFSHKDKSTISRTVNRRTDELNQHTPVVVAEDISPVLPEIIKLNKKEGLLALSMELVSVKDLTILRFTRFPSRYTAW